MPLADKGLADEDEEVQFKKVLLRDLEPLLDREEGDDGKLNPSDSSETEAFALEATDRCGRRCRRRRRRRARRARRRARRARRRA